MSPGASPNRARAYETVRANPGATVAEVANALEVDHSTAAYHLRRLEKEGRIVAERVGRVRSHVVNGDGWCPYLRRVLPRLRPDGAEPTLEALVERPVVRVADAVGEEAEVGEVRWALKRLQEVGLAERIGHGRYRLPQGRETAARRALRRRPCPGGDACAAAGGRVAA
jgi:DNA-binding transcriptional ArsR family regulator